EVCPYNKCAKVSTEDAFKPEGHVVFPKLKDIMLMSNAKFKDIYKPTAAAWRGKKLLQRNAVIIAGNKKTEENFQLLLKSCKDPRPEIRLYSLFSFNEYGTKGKDIVQDRLIKEDIEMKEAFYKYIG